MMMTEEVVDKKGTFLMLECDRYFCTKESVHFQFADILCEIMKAFFGHSYSVAALVGRTTLSYLTQKARSE